MPLPHKNMENNLRNYLEAKRREVNRIIEKYLPRKINRYWIKSVWGKNLAISPLVFQRAFLDPFWEFLDRGGKRWRPILFFLFAEILGAKEEEIKEFSVVPEIVHNGSLIIDDIEDQSELRRGKPSLHKIFGEDLTINLGNFLYFFPLVIFKKNKKKIDSQTYQKLIEIFFEEMVNLHLGQGTDIFWHRGNQKKISEREYLEMCALKTGCMPRLAVRMATILAKREDLEEKLGKIAQSFGIAFQIQDDLMDLTLEGKERKQFGKSFGNDIKEGKRSLIVIYTLTKAEKNDGKRLREILDKKTKSIKEVKEAISIIKKYKGIELARKKKKEILNESLRALEHILPPSPRKGLLREFFLLFGGEKR